RRHPRPRHRPAERQARAGQARSGEDRMTTALLDDLDEVTATGARRVLWLLVAFLAAFLAWAWLFEVDEVSSGAGKVIPSSREQVVQSLEGGIVAELLVSEGDI